MFTGSRISEAFAMGQQKTWHLIWDGISPLLEEKFCKSVSNSSARFTLM